jgi:Rtf2 RING-finger
MGGDGGTLNNSRLDHVRLRRELSVGGESASAQSLRASRSSVTLCAASRQALCAPVVADRLGQLFNKDALIASMLARAPAFAHVRSLRRDTSAEVVLAADSDDDALQCALTRDRVTPDGRFGVGWSCGCVTSNAAVEAVCGNTTAGNSGEDAECVVCGKMGRRIRLGLTREERDAILTIISSEPRKLRGAEKKNQGQKRAAPSSVPGTSEEHKETFRQDQDLRRVRLRQDASSSTGPDEQSSVYKSLFVSSNREENGPA